MSEFGPIIAATRLWPEQDATGFGYFDFLHACSALRQALFYSGLFWPRFEEHYDMIFLEGTIEDESDKQRVQDALIKYEGSRMITEQDFNTIEIPWLFGGYASETTDEEEAFLASQICALLENWGHG
ncbi:MAG: hypothetical protein KF915_20460 [Polyangiaceae bacterium]|nr:hypothetical protein [Polyangiaceae bacterium]